jgi:hypothetical protein
MAIQEDACSLNEKYAARTGYSAGGMSPAQDYESSWISSFTAHLETALSQRGTGR